MFIFRTDTNQDISGQRYGIPCTRPSLYLNSNVTISKGTGTKDDPFELS
ncbi:MAG TPA: hypothetical protein IAB45_02660 [Candidatus Onthousia faecavium]|nr:hypothetical protein [Candidatus Onthousia faecavium]